MRAEYENLTEPDVEASEDAGYYVFKGDWSFDIPVTVDDSQTEVLELNETNGNCNNFAIRDRDISTVDIYILDYIQYMDELKGEDNYNNNENKPEGQKWSDLLDKYAKYHKTLHFDDNTKN